MRGKFKAFGFIALTVLLEACAPAPDSETHLDRSDAVPVKTVMDAPLLASPLATVNVRRGRSGNQIVCQGLETKIGTDVSRYDIDTHWSVAQTAGLSFAFVKATEGVTIVSPLFAGDWGAAKSAGVIRGAYHYFHPADDPVQQAKLFIQTVGTLERNDLPAMLDWETTDHVRPAKQIKRALIWLSYVEAATHKTPIVYVSPAFWNALGNPTAFAKYPLFIAHYGVACPTVPPPWTKWSFWQKGAGVVQGLHSTRTNIDMFNGSPSDLNRLVGATDPNSK
jgi:lysozyme